jgi:hypothetical protein
MDDMMERALMDRVDPTTQEVFGNSAARLAAAMVSRALDRVEQTEGDLAFARGQIADLEESFRHQSHELAAVREELEKLDGRMAQMDILLTHEMAANQTMRAQFQAHLDSLRTDREVSIEDGTFHSPPTGSSSSSPVPIPVPGRLVPIEVEQEERVVEERVAVVAVPVRGQRARRGRKRDAYPDHTRRTLEFYRRYLHLDPSPSMAAPSIPPCATP